ncbi:MAG: M1 family metallopeptidase [bacterium]|nr:M1 family metallopeptidase [bacterium]
MVDTSDLMKRLYPIVIIFLAASVCQPGWAENLQGNLPQPVYEQLTQWQFSEQAIPVPPGGITLKRENASWTMESGYVRLMKPTEHGKVTGLVFEGRGRFRMTIPHWVEKEQLGRISGKKGADDIDESFSKLVIRTPEPILTGLVSTPPSKSYARDQLAVDRHRVWLKLASEDVDARVTAGLFSSSDEFLWIDMKTGSFGWLTYIFDKYLLEEIQLRKFKRKFDWVETWVSLDRESDRGPNGTPSSARRPRLDVTDLSIRADLSRLKLSADSFGTARKMEQARFTVQVSFTAVEDGLRMVPFQLPGARILEVTGANGKLLQFIRQKVDKSIFTRKRDRYIPSLWILLDTPCRKGEKRDIEVTYDLGIHNFTSSDSWYPRVPDNPNDKYMVGLSARLPVDLEIRAVGKQIKETRLGKHKISQWTSEVPVDIYAFTVGKHIKETRLKIDNVPEIIVFGEKWISSGNMLNNVAADVANSLRFYQHLLGLRFPYNTIRVTAIESFYGQCLNGFLHLSQHTFREEHPGASELFRSHEVAHFLWGHMVGFKTYRDQWLSESFAEYFAMLFVQASMPKKKHFRTIIEGYIAELNGSMKTLFNKYAWPWQLTRSKRDRDKIGPISIGRRASVADAPIGYQIQSYHKGALVLHMIRMMMKNATGSDAFFISVMKDFLKTYNGKNATTDDFRGIIEKYTKQDWAWFFDQWIHGTAIPSYSWNYRDNGKDAATGKYKVVVSVKQKGVPEGFRMPVPLIVYLKGGSLRQFNLPINKKQQSFNMAFDKKVKKMVFNPDHAVLAKVRKGN